jgi:DNA-binding NtrC family response regulator
VVKNVKAVSPVANKILVVDDEELVVWAFKENLTKHGYEIDTAFSGKEALKKFKRISPDLVLLDMRLPDISGLEILKEIKETSPNTLVIIITAYSEIENAVQAVKLGAFDYLDKNTSLEELTEKIAKALKSNELKQELNTSQALIKSRFGLEHIIGKNKAFLQVLEMVSILARSNASVLILGESGTGKDLIARAIHQQSPRAKGPFIEVNCSALPDTLLESTLFGHERGAFTDAKELRKGLFEVAQGGSIFLDEIGDMSLAMQAKILKVIETNTIRRLGNTKEIKTDVRIVAATNKDIEILMKEGHFREDLYYRLKTFYFTLPPLRERKDDIPLLATHFVELYKKEYKARIDSISPDALRYLMEYSWPGNIRELKNIMERAVILARTGTITPKHLPSEITGYRDEVGNGHKSSVEGLKFPNNGLSLEVLEKTLLQKALDMAGGNQSEAARLLSISRYTLRYRMKKYGLR